MLEGTPEKIPDKIKNDLLQTVAMNYAVWIPSQFLNFKYIPPHYQVLWANVVGFFWNVYLSMSANKKLVVSAAPEEDRVDSMDQEQSESMDAN